MAQCVRCGMDRGWNLLFCPTCELVQAQKDANDMQRQNQPQQDAGWPEVLGVLTIPIALIVWIFW